MALPIKKRRSITVEGVEYHWTYNYETNRQGTSAVQLATGQGALLKLSVDGELQPADVETAIRFALKNGWTPPEKPEIRVRVQTRKKPTTIELAKSL